MLRMDRVRHGAGGAAFTRLVLEVFKLNGRLLAAGDRIAAPHGLTSARWQVLGALAEAPRTAAQIARAMGLARQSVQRLVDAMRADGILASAANPEHARARLIALTPRGRRLYAAVMAGQAVWANATASGVAAAEIARACRTLAILRRRLEEDARARGKSSRRKT
jgi:DNA-binding MarR family transcriptional regulator